MKYIRIKASKWKFKARANTVECNRAIRSLYFTKKEKNPRDSFREIKEKILKTDKRDRHRGRLKGTRVWNRNRTGGREKRKLTKWIGLKGFVQNIRHCIPTDRYRGKLRASCNICFPELSFVPLRRSHPFSFHPAQFQAGAPPRPTLNFAQVRNYHRDLSKPCQNYLAIHGSVSPDCSKLVSTENLPPSH